MNKQDLAYRRVTVEMERDKDATLTDIFKRLKISPSAYYNGKKSLSQRGHPPQIAATLAKHSRTPSFTKSQDEIVFIKGTPDQIRRFLGE